MLVVPLRASLGCNSMARQLGRGSGTAGHDGEEASSGEGAALQWAEGQVACWGILSEGCGAC